MIFEKEDFGKEKKVEPKKAAESHERKLYSRKMTLYGPDPNMWDQIDHTLPERERAGRQEKIDEFEKELKRLEAD